MKRTWLAAVCLTAPALLMTANAHAHFGMVIPSTAIVTQERKAVDLTLSFSHPFELIGMDLPLPARFSVTANGQTTDLLPTLAETKVMDHVGWQTTFQVTRPGVYHFAMEPQPYWEQGEDLSIIHYTKTIVSAFGDDEGWDQPLGLPVEIVPLTRPFGNYSGNSFTGQVLQHGKPVAAIDVEVELYNEGGRFAAPSDLHITQVVRTDDNGIFTFSCPQPGWWGFAALQDADYTVKNPQGEEKGVELGAVLWIHLDPYLEQ